MKQTAIIYARVSTEEQEENYSLSSQLQACTSYALQHGYDVIDSYSEVYTGTTLDRPELNKIGRQAGKFDVLIVYNVNRLSREPSDLLNFHKMLFQKGTAIEYVSEPVDANSDVGEAMLFFHGWAAKQYRKHMLEQMQRGKQERARTGKVLVCGITPYGYNYNSNEGMFYINETEAEVIRRIYQWYTYGDENGKKLGGIAIAKKLTQLKIPTRYDLAGLRKNKKQYGVWNKSYVMKIINNEMYCGIWYYGVNRHSKNKNNHRNEWIPVPVPAIISREVWELAQEQMKKNTINSPRNSKEQYLFRKRLTCAKCGYSYRCRTETMAQSRNRYGYYVCLGKESFNSPDGLKPTCTRRIRQDYLEALIWGAIAELLTHPEHILAALNEQQTATEKELELIREYVATSREKIETLEKKRSRLLDLYLEGKVEKELYETKRAELERLINDQRERLAGYQERITVSEISVDQAKNIQAFCGLASQGIDDFTYEEKLMVIDMLDVRGLIYRGAAGEADKIVLTGHIPTIEICDHNTQIL